MTRKYRPVVERFLEKVSIGTPNQCWPFTGYRMPFGHGQFSLGRDLGYKLVLAHRYAYELWVGVIPDGMVVMHVCDNPPCCNPAHLRLGTQGDNLRDAFAKGRMHTLDNPRREMCKKGLHRLDETNVYVSPSGRRRCKTCRDEYRRRYYEASE